MPDDNAYEFITSIYKNSGGGYKIWIPKSIMDILPDDAWSVSAHSVECDGFKQKFSSHPISKGGKGQGYIPIYCEEIMTDYTQLGKVKVKMVLG